MVSIHMTYQPKGPTTDLTVADVQKHLFEKEWGELTINGGRVLLTLSRQGETVRSAVLNLLSKVGCTPFVGN